MGQRTEIDLYDSLMDMSLVDFSKCNTVFEDGSYKIHFASDEHSRENIKSIILCVNGESVGCVNLDTYSTLAEGDITYSDRILAGQPFLLHYDLISLSFVLTFVDETKVEYYSDFLLCASKNEEDANNISKMLQDLIAFDDTQVGEWLFSDVEKDSGNSLYEGKWEKHAYKSLTSYIQLLEKVVSCYRSNYAYFKMQGKHTLKRSNVLVPYNKVKAVSLDSFNWIVQNTAQLAESPHNSGIRYNGKNYLPYRIKADTNKKSWNVYENRVVVGFLYTALLNAKQVRSEFEKDVLHEERIISKIHGNFPKEYRAPIITIKTLQISFCRVLLGKLSQSISLLQNTFEQYSGIFDTPNFQVTRLPRKTSTFCELRPYTQVFEVIVKWFQYGEYSLEKERLILQVKTLDKLFEYYCLLRLLKLLADNGFKKADIPMPVYKHVYTSANAYYHNERDVANTYILDRNGVSVTLYYQPVISSTQFENSLTLYRTTSRSYYTPDFVLKFSSNEHNEEYAIFDAKFSSRANIKERHLPEVIRKYSIEMEAAADIQRVKMVWVLQGRVNSNENSIWRYHNSPMAYMYHPTTSYGVVSINTTSEIRQRLWEELKKSISLI